MKLIRTSSLTHYILFVGTNVSIYIINQEKKTLELNP